MDNDSTNLQPPAYGPTFPTYPPLDQLVRVNGPALAGTSPRVYPAAAQQFVPPLSLRDREAVYVMEPNNVALAVGVYDCRLVGSYPLNDPAARPLYETTCCPAASSSSSPGPS